MARDEKEHAAATHGTVSRRRDLDDVDDGDTRRVAVYTRVHIRLRVAAVVQGDLT